MPELLLELFSEEIPARMQARAADDLKKVITDPLVAAGLVYEGAKAFATPRRLALTVHGVPARQPDLKEERKGPKVGAPEQAIAGFLRAAGLASIDQAKVQADKKGDFYVAVTEKPGRAAIDVIADMIPEVVRGFPWPKSMRWGTGRLDWVRPLRAIVATFGPETEEPEIVRFDIDGIAAGNITRGHRFMAPGAITVRRFDDYVAALERAKVVLDPARRKDMIRADAEEPRFRAGLRAGRGRGAAGRGRRPGRMAGDADGRIRQGVPRHSGRGDPRHHPRQPEVLRAARSADGKLVNKFILIANIEASDGGKAIVAGNERVIRARLTDAKFFYETDLKTKLEDRLPKFGGIVFHEKLGTQAERIARITALAEELAPLVRADPAKAARAAQLCKADLLTEVVGEFPELQGLMGRYYAQAQGEDAAVAQASEDHYKPVGPKDSVPTDPVSIAVALADKIDTLVGFWAIDEKPTGSKDPYALRRAALGVIRLILDNQITLSLRNVVEQHCQKSFARQCSDVADAAESLMVFFEDRLTVQLKEQRARHDLVDSVLSNGSLVAGHSLLQIVRRVEALGKFLDTDDGKNLLAGVKRASNILRIEEKKDGKSFGSAPDWALLKEPEEKALAAAIATAKEEASAAVAKEDFAAAMSAMAKLRPTVDAFFDKVTVNADDKALRENRLRLLSEIREATRAVADFSKIEG